MVGLHLAVLIIFSEAAPANGVDTEFYIFTVVSLPSGASVRKDVWVQVPPSAPSSVNKKDDKGSNDVDASFEPLALSNFFIS